MRIPDHTRVKIGVIFYSFTGNTMDLARAVAEGAERVAGATAELHPVAELAPMDVIEGDERLMRVYEEKQDLTEAQVDMLRDYDGFLFGTPTRYGRLTSQLAQFLDQTGSVWQSGDTIGKPAGVFTSTSTVHGGQETTITSLWTTLAHLGMLPVGVPYSETRLFAQEPGGGSPYGASSVSGPESDQGPTEREKEIARTHGQRVAELAKVLKAGRRVVGEDQLETLAPPA